MRFLVCNVVSRFQIFKGSRGLLPRYKSPFHSSWLQEKEFLDLKTSEFCVPVLWVLPNNVRRAWSTWELLSTSAYRCSCCGLDHKGSSGASENPRAVCASWLAFSAASSLEGAWFIATGDLSQTCCDSFFWSEAACLLTLPVRLGGLRCQLRMNGGLLYALLEKPQPFRVAVKSIRCSNLASSDRVSVTFSVDAPPPSGIQNISSCLPFFRV